MPVRAEQLDVMCSQLEGFDLPAAYEAAAPWADARPPV